MTYSRIIITLAVATISAGLLLPGAQLARNIIRFPQPPDTALNASPVTLSAEASSALAVTYTSNSLAICTVSGSSVKLLAVGVCSITANQSGNGTFPAADPAVVTFSALQGTQLINFPQPPDNRMASGTLSLTATATSGLPVNFVSNASAVCTVSGATVTHLSTGICSITATQPGNSNYAAAPAVTRTFSISIAAAFPADALQIRYASNLTLADSVIKITNTAANGDYVGIGGFGSPPYNLCVNVYTFSSDEQLVSCCSCLITPNGLVSLSVNQDLLSNTVTGVRPNSAVVKLVNTGPTAQYGGTGCTNSAALAGSVTYPPAAGMLAFGTTVQPGVGAGVFATTETPFLMGTLSPAELASITNRSANIIGNGSSFGICRSCRAGGLNSEK